MPRPLAKAPSKQLSCALHASTWLAALVACGATACEFRHCPSQTVLVGHVCRREQPDAGALEQADKAAPHAGVDAPGLVAGGAGRVPGVTRVQAGTAHASAAGSASTGGHAAAGAGGMGQAPSGCRSDGECHGHEPACRSDTATCVECTQDMHCGGMACDASTYRCVECTRDRDCASGACDVSNQRCVSCTRDSQCVDARVDTCVAHQCVDCDQARGCDDDPTRRVCLQHSCVECDADQDCGWAPGRSRCLRPQHTCVACLQRHGDCADPKKPICDGESSVCVQCLDDGDCGGGRCLGQQCVQCIEDVECGMADSAHCDGDHKCTGCTANVHCAHLVNAPVCDGKNGQCVQCVDDTACGEFACIRSMHTCSTTKRGTVSACGTCAADSECGPDMKCVEMQFLASAAAPRIKHCLYNNIGGACTAASLRPFTHEWPAKSVDAIYAESVLYCAPPRNCEAYLDTLGVGKKCSKYEDCGYPEVADGVCGDTGHCTYFCVVDGDCPANGQSRCLPESGRCGAP